MTGTIRPRGKAGSGASLTVITALAVMTLLAACRNGSAGQAAVPVAVLTSSQMMINGIGQGMTGAEVAAVLGPPLSRRVPFYAFMSDDSMVLWRYQGLGIELVDQVVDRLICTARCATSNGIRIGDSAARVIRTYGRAETLARPFSGLLIYHHAEVPCSMIFTLGHDRVSRIEITCEEEN